MWRLESSVPRWSSRSPCSFSAASRKRWDFCRTGQRMWSKGLYQAHPRLHPRSPHHIRKPACHHIRIPCLFPPLHPLPAFLFNQLPLHPPPIPIMRPNLNPLPLIFPHHAPSKKHLIHHINPILLIQKRPLHFNDPILHLTYHLPFSIYYAPTTTLSRRSAPGGSRPTSFQLHTTRPHWNLRLPCGGHRKRGQKL